MDFSKLIIKFVIFVVLMLIGYYYARKKIVGPEFAKGASKLTLDVFMSAAIINSVIANPPQMSGRELWWGLLIISMCLFISYALGAAAVRVLPGQRDNASMELLMCVPNSMFIALPVIQQVLGSQGVFYVALSNIPFNLLLFTYGIWRLKGGGKAVKIKAKEFFSIPLLATIFSVVIFLLRIEMPMVVKELVGTMSGATMPLSMLVIGASLGSVRIKEAFTAKHSFIVSAVKLIMSPMLVYFILRLFTDDPALLYSATIIAASPSGIIVSVLAMQYGHDAVYTSEAVLTSTALAMVTMPALVYILMGV